MYLEPLNMKKCLRLFSKFRNGDFNLQKVEGFGKSSKINEDFLRSIIEIDPQHRMKSGEKTDWVRKAIVIL